MKDVCSVCGKKCDVGADAVMKDGKVVCDDDARVKHDKRKHAWFPDDRSHVYEDLTTGERTAVTRKKAFARKKGK
ncbi:hypothetical protein HYW61_00040 [candidate division WWE3 bacterium]|nr:hypothetical protein [candidate division WWE3 bacterium]